MTSAPPHAAGDRPTHLGFYVAHGISPVRQDISDLDAHLQRRQSLYRAAGLMPAVFRDRNVLEVGPGSGHNCLFLAQCLPRTLEMVEPNPHSAREIEGLYASFDRPHRAPVLHRMTLQAFETEPRFDVVLCEHWLGAAPEERAMLRKLGALVAPDGVLVVTATSPVGILPNLLRNALAARLVDDAAPFEARGETLLEAFGTHLATMPHMTRPPIDWVRDTLLNPAFFGVCLTVPMIIEDVGAQFDVHGSCPRFATDWRWHKSLFGEQRDFNGHFLRQYHRVSHNLLDHRMVLPDRDSDANRSLEAAAWSLLEAVRAFRLRESDHVGPVISAIEDVAAAARDLPPIVRRALDETAAALARPRLAPADVAGMTTLANLFGRESILLSVHRAR